MWLTVRGWLILCGLGVLLGLFTAKWSLVGSALLAGVVVITYGVIRAGIRGQVEKHRQSRDLPSG